MVSGKVVATVLEPAALPVARRRLSFYLGIRHLPG
jgi:hypothetical protein